jgi:catechol 2,3-dioxygenase-like lactoylglutathione lyase family enzyme
VTPRIGIVTLGVSHVAASRAFYAMLGFSGSPASDDNVAFNPFFPLTEQGRIALP